MNRNSVIALLIGVVLGAGGYYIVDRIARPIEMEAQPAMAEEPAPLPSVAAEGAMKTEEAVAEMPEAETAEAPLEPAAELETEP
jgi:hypothetical protein